MRLLLGFLCFGLLASLTTHAQGSHVELGDVGWLRSYDEALSIAKAEDKPILILFQEVPGCATCRNYGQDVLTHPLIVEIIQENFVPLAIFNNEGGADALILKKFGEPSWNNPVVRIINNQEQEIANRVAGNYSIQGLLQALITAYGFEGKPVPEYMNLLTAEFADELDQQYYSMHCFWSGEAAFGSQSGVVSTEPAWMSGKEVVKIVYDTNTITQKALDNIAAAKQYSAIDYHKSYNVDGDPQYYLKQTDYKYLPLSQAQKTRINSALGKGEDPQQYLSPQQLTWLSEVSKGQIIRKERYTLPLKEAWDDIKAY